MVLPVEAEDARPVEVVLFRRAGARIMQHVVPPRLVVGRRRGAESRRSVNVYRAFDDGSIASSPLEAKFSDRWILPYPPQPEAASERNEINEGIVSEQDKTY